MASPTKLYGLVLSGGKSTRMGTDKGQITYHGIPQHEYLYDMLGKVCDRTYLSIRKEQIPEIPSTMNTIVDGDVFKGPFNGLFSAHDKHPEVAWLVLACDLPLFTKNSLKDLIKARDIDSLGTAFTLKENSLPEPLCAIWEPKGLTAAIHYLKEGASNSPRKFLKENKINLVFPKDPNELMNANSVEDYKEALTKLTSV